MTISVMGFFAMAIVGWVCGLTPFACAVKATTGAAALYVVIRFAGWLAVNIITDVIVGDLSGDSGSRRHTGGARNK